MSRTVFGDTIRPPSPPIEDPVTHAPRRALPPTWTDPPLPAGAKPPTPGGDHTIRSGGGLTSSALVGPACRVPILFGRCRISPDIVAVEQANFRVRFLVVISEGPIDAVEDWLTDPAETFESIDVTLGSLTTPAFGLEGTVGLAAANIWTKAGKPYQPRGIFRGMLLYDPRLGSWGPGKYPTPAHTIYSTNPALMMVYLLLFPQFGWGRPNVTPSLVDWTSVEDAADWCDEDVDGQKRYEVNLHLQQGEDASLWSETIGLHAGLRWTEAEGLWRLEYSAPVATVAATITDDHVVKGTEPRLSYGSGAGLADRPNVFTAEWIDPASDWQVRTVEIRHPSVDAGEPKRAAQVYKFHGFHSEAMCLRALWRVACDIWSEQELEAELTTEMLHLVDGSRVTVLLPSLGLSGVDFLVTRTGYDADQVRITARRYDAATWSAPGSSSVALPGSGVFGVPPALTSLAIAEAETEITASSPTSRTTVIRLGAEWTLPVFAWSWRVVVRYWNAYTTTPGWDDAGFEEFFFPLTGTPGLGSDPDWIGSLSPHDWQTTVDTFDALGQNTFSSITAPGLTIGAKLESASGRLSAPVFASRPLATSVSSSLFPTEAAAQVTGETRADGEVAVWDAAASAIRFEPGAGGASLTVMEADGSPAVSSVSTIEVIGATVVDRGSGTARISISGGSSVPAFHVETFTAAGGDEEFTPAYTPAGLGYVAVDGLITADAEDLGASFNVFGLGAGQTVVIGYWSSVLAGTSSGTFTFGGDGSTTDFDLGVPPAMTLVVAVGGVVQGPADWTLVSPLTYRFTTAPPIDSAIVISALV